MTERNCSGVSRVAGPAVPTPALLTRPSTRPNVSIASSTSRWHCSGSATSVATAWTRRPVERTDSATRSSLSTRRAPSTTSAPASAKPWANATPSPLEAPVTMTTLSSRRNRSRTVMAETLVRPLAGGGWGGFPARGAPLTHRSAAWRTPARARAVAEEDSGPAESPSRTARGGGRQGLGGQTPQGADRPRAEHEADHDEVRHPRGDEDRLEAERLGQGTEGELPDRHRDEGAEGVVGVGPRQHPVLDVLLHGEVPAHAEDLRAGAGEEGRHDEADEGRRDTEQQHGRCEHGDAQHAQQQRSFQPDAKQHDRGEQQPHRLGGQDVA